MQPGGRDGTLETAELAARLGHVYWIGGGSGAGKSTLARRLADRHGWRLYATDDAMPEHARRTTPEEAPLLHEFLAMDMDERWVNRSPGTMFETFHWFHGEGFGLIVEDLLGMGRETGVVVEGFRLLPHLVKPLLTDPAHAVWLLPTPDFRQAVFAVRTAAGTGFTARTSDPERAGRNLAARDHIFTTRLREETARLRLTALDVALTMAEDELLEQVSNSFRL